MLFQPRAAELLEAEHGVQFLVRPVVARFNPVNWAVEASRSAISSGTDWWLVGTRTAFLAALLLVCGALGTRAFGAYQRSVPARRSAGFVEAYARCLRLTLRPHAEKLV